MTLPDLHLGWILFGPLVLALLATDLILFHRDPRPVDRRTGRLYPRHNPRDGVFDRLRCGTLSQRR